MKPMLARALVGVTLVVGIAVDSARNAGPALSIAFVGDTGQGDQAQDFVKRHGLHKSFEHAGPALRDADFAVGNAETPIVDDELQPVAAKKRFMPKQVPRVAQVYADEGFNAFSLANNHTMDYGVEGLKQTLDHLAGAGIRTFGAGLDKRAATQPVVFERDDTRIAVLGYFEHTKGYDKLKWYAGPDRPGVAPMATGDLREDIARLRQQVDVVVVYPHFNQNYRKITRGQRRLVRRAVQAGADLVIGHGPHIAQKVELVDGVPVLYSVGNFIWHSKGLYRRREVEDRAFALVARVEFDGRRPRRIELRAFHCDNRRVQFVPRPATGEQAHALFADILEPVAPFVTMSGTTAVLDLPEPRSAPQHGGERAGASARSLR